MALGPLGLTDRENHAIGDLKGRGGLAKYHGWEVNGAYGYLRARCEVRQANFISSPGVTWFTLPGLSANDSYGG